MLLGFEVFSKIIRTYAILIYSCIEFGIPIVYGIKKDDASFLNNEIILWVFKKKKKKTIIFSYQWKSNFTVFFSILKQEIKILWD